MSLTVLVAIVVIGIMAVVVAVHMTGGTREAELTSEAEARRRFAEDFPNETIVEVVVTKPPTAAFLLLESTRTGIVQAVGMHFLTRIVRPADLTVVDADGAALCLRTRDFTWSGGRFVFAGAPEAQRIAQRLSPANRNEQRKSA
ncbi:hypothetical protein GN330_10015 [Nitratireductor sp. CAU 1489]|uniref:Uncharacterized protein n=1 Tax=Nitratireductor arenosus TaxID=2682096 RepID=A0A844QHX6_9HYPH|nr:hypothetical protein [Nitratireductor arenosus]MVA97580.1 hypothetical protein [Nitratireductor arenosus]